MAPYAVAFFSSTPTVGVGAYVDTTSIGPLVLPAGGPSCPMVMYVSFHSPAFSVGRPRPVLPTCVPRGAGAGAGAAGALVVCVELRVLETLVHDEPATVRAGFGRSDELAVFSFPVGIAHDVPAREGRSLDGSVWFEIARIGRVDHQHKRRECSAGD